MYYRIETRNEAVEVDTFGYFDGKNAGMYAYYAGDKYLQEYLPVTCSATDLKVGINSAACYFTEYGMQYFKQCGEYDYYLSHLKQGTTVEYFTLDEDLSSQGLVAIYQDEHQVVVCSVAALQAVRAGVLNDVSEGEYAGYRYQVYHGYEGSVVCTINDLIGTDGLTAEDVEYCTYLQSVSSSSSYDYEDEDEDEEEDDYIYTYA